MSMDSKDPLSSAEHSVPGRAESQSQQQLLQAPLAFICLQPLKTPGKRPLGPSAPQAGRNREKQQLGVPIYAVLPTAPTNPEQHGTHGMCQPSLSPALPRWPLCPQPPVSMELVF